MVTPATSQGFGSQVWLGATITGSASLGPTHVSRATHPRALKAGPRPELLLPFSSCALNHLVYKNPRTHIREIWIMPFHFLKNAKEREKSFPIRLRGPVISSPSHGQSLQFSVPTPPLPSRLTEAREVYTYSSLWMLSFSRPKPRTTGHYKTWPL